MHCYKLSLFVISTERRNLKNDGNASYNRVKHNSNQNSGAKRLPQIFNLQLSIFNILGHRIMTKREKIMIGAAVSAVVFVCFYMFFYQPEKKELLRLQEEIKTVALEIDRIVRAIPGLRNLEKEVAREQKSAFLVKRIPSGEKPVQELLRQLAGEASMLDMDVISLRSGEESESAHGGSPYKRLAVVMNIQCPYRHLGSYLKRVNDLPGLVTVNELEIVRDNQIFPRVKVKLTLGVWVKS